MPVRHIVCSTRHEEQIERQEAEDRVRAMRRAVAVGIADIEAGRYRDFDSADALREHLSNLADEAIRGANSADDRT